MRWKNLDIPDQAILTYIENSPRFMNKVARLLGQVYGKRATKNTTAQERTEKATNAARARWDQAPKKLN